MDSLLNEYGFEQISDGYYISNDFGTILQVENILAYDPIGSSVSAEETSKFLNDFILDARRRSIVCSLIVDFSSITDEEKEIYPKALASFNDPDLEEKFSDFVSVNAPYFKNNKFEGIDQTNCELFVDFKETPKFTIGNFDVDKDGSSKKIVFFQTDDHFSLQDLTTPLPMMEELFPECKHVELKPEEEHFSVIPKINELIEEFPNQKFFFDTTVSFIDNALFHVVTFHYSDDYGETNYDNYDENGDEIDPSGFPKSISIPVVDGEFHTDAPELESIRTEIRKLKFKSMF